MRIVSVLLLLILSNGYVINTDDIYSTKLFNRTSFHRSFASHLAHDETNFDDALYFSLSMEYRLLRNDNSTMDLGLAIANNNVMLSSFYVDIAMRDWTVLNVVHRVPLSQALFEESLSDDFYLLLHFGQLDTVNDSSVALEVKENYTLTFLPQPDKIPLGEIRADTRDVCTDSSCENITTSNTCRLLGSANAVLLNYVQFSEAIAGDSVKVFCGIFSTEQHHTTQIKALKNTWASKCTGFLVFSTVSDLSIPSVSLRHSGEESYRNIWQKVRNIWRYIHKHYLHEYDYFLLGGDDMYLVMENLYAYLNSGEIKALRALNQGIYLGRTFVNPLTKIAFNSGGPGYLLDAVALETLVLNLDEPHCSPNEYTSEEDTFVAMCLNSSLNHILPHNTSDEYNRQRFHHFTPAFYVTYRAKYDPVTGEGLDWYSRLDTHIREDEECCSDFSVSFHSIYEDLMYSIHDYLYRCPLGEILKYYKEQGMNYFYRIDRERFHPDK